MQNPVIGVVHNDGSVTVSVRGEIDFTNSDEVTAGIRSAVAEWSPPELRVDLGAATFIDSTGLGALIEGYRAATDADARFVVVGPTESFRRVLAITGLTELFGLSPEAAGKAVRPDLAI